MAVHRRAIVVDTHSDITEAIVYSGYDFAARHSFGDEDLPRMREGGLDAQFFSIWLNPARFPKERWFAETEHELLAAREALAKVPGMALATTAADVRANKQRGVISALFGVEGGHSLQPGSEAEQLARLQRFAALGVRYLTLTWSNSNDLGGSSGDDGEALGLTPLGLRVLREMERLGIVADVSHLSEPLFWDVLRAAKKPVLASHSSARALSGHPRNLTDAQLRAVAKNGGAVCVTFVPHFLDEGYAAQLEKVERIRTLPIHEQRVRLAARLAAIPPVPLSKLVDHFEHVLRVAGPEHVCIGSDFDGILTKPQGMEDVSKLPSLTQALLGRGHREDELAALLGGNVLRVLEANEPK